MILLVTVLFICLLFLPLVLFWLYQKRHSTAGVPHKGTVKLCAVLGSGGHTTEMLTLMEKLGSNYSPRLYIIAKTDSLSHQKLIKHEKNRASGEFRILTIGRSREVLQSYLTSVFTTVLAFFESLWLVYSNGFNVLLCNGPGTCIPVCFAVALFDLVRLRDTKIIYFESICRVKRLSLSALILYYLRIPDLIAVYWQDLVEKYPRTKHIDNLGENF